MPSSVKFVQYRPELRNDVLNLTKHLWGPNSSGNAAYLDWKYRDNPNLGWKSPLIFLALDDGKVIGMRGVHATRLEADGNEGQVIPCFGDTVVSPEFRGRRLLTPLTELAIATLEKMGYHYLLGVSNIPATYFHLLKLGWKPAVYYMPQQRFSWRLRWLSRGYRLARRLPIVADWASAIRQKTSQSRSIMFAKDDGVFADLDENSASGEPSISVATDARPEAMADLIRRLGGDGRIRQVRDVPYLDWRYKNPHADYRFFFHGYPEIRGYVVVHSRRFDNFGGVNLVDWEATTSDVRRDLLRAALNWGRFKSVTTWSQGLQDETLNLLHKEGFRSKNEWEAVKAYRPGILIRSFSTQNYDESAIVGRRCLFRGDDWDLRMLYSDSF